MGLFSIARRAPAPGLESEAASFWKRGFLVIPGAFKKEEMAVLKAIVARHAGMKAHAARALERSAEAVRDVVGVLST